MRQTMGPSMLAEPTPDPRLASLLNEFPADLFSPSLYRSHELVDSYALAWAVELVAGLDLAATLAAGGTAEEIRTARGLVPAFAAPLVWVLDRLAAEGLLLRTGAADESPRYQLTAPLPTLDRAALRAAALAEDAANTRTLDLLDAAAAAYPRVAHGEASGDEAMLGPARIELWLRYFDNANAVYAVGNRVAAIVAAHQLARVPGNSRRVLEVGAGAGSGTAALLAALTDRGNLGRLGHYQVTEPGQFFRRRAERSLRAQYPTAPLAFSGLDIDGDWSAQGVAGESYDLVFGVNVFHVARNLLHALRAAWSTLAPGGWLVAGECLRPFSDSPTAAELAFRLLSGYHAVELDPELRPIPGFLSPEQWQRALSAAGFVEVAVRPDVREIREIYPRFSVGAIVGRRPL
jgi:SAM-dependent methyltransferase